jgi:hypothetical protein
MNLGWLHQGMLGALEAGGLSLLVAFLLHGVAHWIGRRAGWSEAGQIGRAFMAALVLSAGPDIWYLLYMGIVPLESVVTIQRLLAHIHDPAWLGVRVVMEFIGAGFGVMLGWLLWTGAARRELARHRSRRDSAPD